MRVFVIGPVRNATVAMKMALSRVVNELEAAGHTVYLPSRDTRQDDDETGGYRICHDNLLAIREADEVWVAWNGESQGSLFDLGMAFALAKHIRLVPGAFPDRTTGKSFANMVRYWKSKHENC